MEMGQKFVENDFFKNFGQKWKVRNGTVVFQKIFVKRWLFQQRFDDGSLQITWYNASGKRCVDDVRDGRQEDVKVFIKKRDGIRTCNFFWISSKYLGLAASLKMVSLS